MKKYKQAFRLFVSIFVAIGFITLSFGACDTNTLLGDFGENLEQNNSQIVPPQNPTDKDDEDLTNSPTPDNPSVNDGEQTPDNPSVNDGEQTPDNPPANDGEQTPNNPPVDEDEQTPDNPPADEDEQEPQPEIPIVITTNGAITVGSYVAVNVSIDYTLRLTFTATHNGKLTVSTKSEQAYLAIDGNANCIAIGESSFSLTLIKGQSVVLLISSADYETSDISFQISFVND